MEDHSFIVPTFGGGVTFRIAGVVGVVVAVGALAGSAVALATDATMGLSVIDFVCSIGFGSIFGADKVTFGGSG